MSPLGNPNRRHQHTRERDRGDQPRGDRVRPPRLARSATAATVCFAATVVLSALVQQPTIGSAAPLPPVRDLNGVERPLRELAGPRGLVIVFWAGWSDRSIEELQRLSATRSQLETQGVTVAAVNVEHEAVRLDEVQAGVERLRSLGVVVPILVDDGLSLFRAYGVVTVPTTVLVNHLGEVTFFTAGYSNAGREELFDAIATLAGESPRAAPAAPAAAPAALRRLQLGRAELARDRVEAARRAFETAATADPSFPDPLVELAALALDSGDRTLAGDLLDRALALRSDDPAARRERARAQFLRGADAEALVALEQLTDTTPDAVALAYLALVHQVGGRLDAAAAALARAVEAGGPDPAPAATREAAAAEMTRYRRASGLRKR